MSNPKEIDFDKPFILHVRFKNGLESYKLTEWLTENGFKYDDEKHDWFYDTYIKCDNLTDAAKIETFIQSPTI